MQPFWPTPTHAVSPSNPALSALDDTLRLVRARLEASAQSSAIEGVFRVPGAHEEVKGLVQAALTSGRAPPALREAPLHTAASVLKRLVAVVGETRPWFTQVQTAYLWNLVPLLKKADHDPAAVAHSARSILASLEPETAGVLARFLDALRFTASIPESKLTPASLAVCVAPSLLGDAWALDLNAVVAMLIRSAPLLFTALAPLGATGSSRAPTDVPPLLQELLTSLREADPTAVQQFMSGWWAIKQGGYAAPPSAVSAARAACLGGALPALPATPSLRGALTATFFCDAAATLPLVPSSLSTRMLTTASMDALPYTPQRRESEGLGLLASPEAVRAASAASDLAADGEARKEAAIAALVRELHPQAAGVLALAAETVATVAATTGSPELATDLAGALCRPLFGEDPSAPRQEVLDLLAYVAHHLDAVFVGTLRCGVVRARPLPARPVSAPAGFKHGGALAVRGAGEAGTPSSGSSGGGAGTSAAAAAASRRSLPATLPSHGGGGGGVGAEGEAAAGAGRALPSPPKPLPAAAVSPQPRLPLRTAQPTADDGATMTPPSVALGVGPAVPLRTRTLATAAPGANGSALPAKPVLEVSSGAPLTAREMRVVARQPGSSSSSR